MRSSNRLLLTKRSVEALPAADRETVYWDRDLAGFGVRVYPSGAKVYMVHTRAKGKSRRVTIGRHGLWSAEDARSEAGRLIADIKGGGAPVRPGSDAASASGPTIAELAKDYMTGHVAVHCKPGTARSVGAILDKHVLPEFGRLRLGEITPDRIAALHYRLHETPIMANQAVDLLSRLYNRAAASDDPPATGNPCRFIKKYPARSRERFLTEQEFARLGAVLDQLAAAGRISASAHTAIRLLMLTGCRRSEVLTLKWEDVDLEHDPTPVARFEDRGAGGPAVAGRPEDSRRAAPHPRQPLGHSGERARPAPRQCEPGLGVRPREGRPQGRANPRPAALLRLAGARPGPQPDDDRQAARPPSAADDRPVRSPCAAVGEVRRRERGR